MKTFKPPYSPQFRQQMVELVKAGRNPKDLAQEFGCHVSSILGWMRQADAQANPTPGVLTAAEREELIRLRKELRQVQMERDILAKATAWFANSKEGTLK